MQKIYVLAGVALMMAACGGNEKAYDATGTFEATETCSASTRATI